MVEKLSRPRIIGGITIKTPTGCGNMYIQLNWCNGRLFEVFATLGKTGGCATAESEALTRSITLGLRSGVPVVEYVDQLRNIRCPSPYSFPKEDTALSCPDALGRALERYGNLSYEQVLEFIASANEPRVIDGEEEAKQAEIRMTKQARIREEQDL